MYKALHFLKYILNRGWRKEEDTPEQDGEEEDRNPYLAQLREIMEQVLEKRKISYAEFAPVILDGGDSEAALFSAKLLGRDLNRLIILTDNPEYFVDFADNMYEEHGLIAEIYPKNAQKITEASSDMQFGNVILDFEHAGEEDSAVRFEKKIYIPVFKKRWEGVGNLDIAVPIGYNTMIVRGSENAGKQIGFDKFERAFYENE